MTQLDILLKPFRTYISSQSSELSTQALKQMSVSKDPYHDLSHIERMLRDLEQFLKTSPDSQQVNPEVLVLSVSWHDTWKSHRLAKNMVELLHHQWMDGLGSAALFEEASTKMKLPNELKKQVAYAIRKHAHFQFFPVGTEEAHVLRDLDNLELWSVERLDRGESIYAFAANWRLKLFRDELEKLKLHTDWAKQQKQQRQTNLADKLNDLLRRRGGLS